MWAKYVHTYNMKLFGIHHVYHIYPASNNKTVDFVCYFISNFLLAASRL